MKRAYRLRRPEHFRRVRREGKTFSSATLHLNLAANRRKSLRCGFVVSKHIGSAVERNRAKRRVREAVRLVLPSIHPSYDIVFVIRSATVATVIFSTLQAEVITLLQRANIWREPATDTHTQGR
jgi:ribonuclease P protein component